MSERAFGFLVAGGILVVLLLAGSAAAEEGDLLLSMSGDLLIFAGTTNLAPGDRLVVNVVSAGFTPTEKGTGGGFAGAGGTVVVTQGSPLNQYSFVVNVSAFPPGEYLVTVESVETGYRDSARFTLPLTPTPTEVPSVPSPAQEGTTTPPVAVTETIPQAPPSATPAPLLWAVPLGACLLAACLLLRNR